jgi:hypothetical protein
MICSLCHRVVEKIWRDEDRIPYTYSEGFTRDQKIAHHSTFTALQLSAENRKICELVLGTITKQLRLEAIIELEKEGIALQTFVTGNIDRDGRRDEKHVFGEK